MVKMPVPAPKSPSIAVMGSNGGVGASLLAQNLAFHGAAPKGANRRMALLDADLQFGSQAIDLDRDETGGLYEALVAPDRIDATFLSATMDHLTETLSLYSHQIRAGQEAQSLEQACPGSSRRSGPSSTRSSPICPAARCFSTQRLLHSSTRWCW